MTRIFLGHISAANGLKGDVLIKSHTADPQAIGDYGPLSNEDESQTLRLRVKRVTAKGVIAHVAGVDSRNAAEALRGTKLFVARDQLPDADEDDFYIADLIGLDACDTDGAPFGRVVNVHNFGAGDLLEIKRDGAAATELVPFTKAFVPDVDMTARKIVVALTYAEDDSNSTNETNDDDA